MNKFACSDCRRTFKTLSAATNHPCFVSRNKIPLWYWYLITNKSLADDLIEKSGFDSIQECIFRDRVGLREKAPQSIGELSRSYNLSPEIIDKRLKYLNHKILTLLYHNVLNK